MVPFLGHSVLRRSTVSKFGSASPYKATERNLSITVYLLRVALFLIISLLCVNLTVFIVVNFTVAILTLILNQLVPFSPLLFTLNLITVTHCYNYSLPQSQLHRPHLSSLCLDRQGSKRRPTCSTDYFYHKLFL